MNNFLPSVALVAVVVAATGMLTGSFAAAVRGVVPPEPCGGCGGPATAGHQCTGGAR